ncbi:unnamed protein product [Sphenostylis stenocarpa]|uniref:NAC domain-containing protein n=1 Tax=Sphenostylis stenocarpa TaxID=92480 RepID=A0AA86RL54_9FABA|nr:unnamed protein product [Sphenostylis stenocarpa]
MSKVHNDNYSLFEATPSVSHPNQVRGSVGSRVGPIQTAGSFGKHTGGGTGSDNQLFHTSSNTPPYWNFPLTYSVAFALPTERTTKTLGAGVTGILAMWEMLDSEFAMHCVLFPQFPHTLSLLHDFLDLALVGIQNMSWLIDIGGFAKKVKSTTLSSADQIKDCGAYRECPNCYYRIDNSDVSTEWPGFPLGVKFDASDVELLEHLAGKLGVGNTQPHVFINEFIPTREEDHGICYTHPENLPGAKKDGSYVHFFHKTINAYASGQRKRRKIHHQQGLTEEHVRWHKTGRTKAIMENGICKGYKKIMVLYVRSKSGSKPHKSNWVMHQYHLGSEEDEKEGEYVVSKIFYQQKKQTEENEDDPMPEDTDNIMSRTGPRTPKPNSPNPPRAGKSVDCDDYIDETVHLSSAQDAKTIPGESHTPLSDIQDLDNSAWLAGESQAEEHTAYDGLDDILLCKEILDSSARLNDSELDSTNLSDLAFFDNQMARNDNESCGISVLDTLELDTPPDFDFSTVSLIGWTGYDVLLDTKSRSKLNLARAGILAFM